MTWLPSQAIPSTGPLSFQISISDAETRMRWSARSIHRKLPFSSCHEVRMSSPKPSVPGMPSTPLTLRERGAGVLNSVFQHVYGVLNGLALPGQSNLLLAHVVPPPMEPLGSQPIAYITLGGTAKGKRQTMPRPQGFTSIDWPVAITVDWQDLASDPAVDQAFYLITDAVLAALWADPMPMMITDPTTGVQTQMTAIGEDYTVRQGALVTTAPGRLYLFRAEIITTVREKTQTGAYLGGG